MLLNTPVFFRQLVLGVLGFCSGGFISAGVFSFLAMIGIYPRLIGKTRTHSKIKMYETIIILGGIWGNYIDLYTPSFVVPFAGILLLLLFGGATGIFVGCLVMSLAETLKALPIISRRIHLSVGFQYVVLAIGLGKCAGSFFYFLKGLGT